MSSRVFLAAVLLVLVVESQGAFLNRTRRLQISCRYLRHVFRNYWFSPKCNKDGTFKNPQCFQQGSHYCCCVNANPTKIVKTMFWIGDCMRHHPLKHKLPVCLGPKMVKRVSKV
eukprot:Seg1417.6 transcript_id=Seg1417.6/GoldUCD/mRNA.D3Y31 product="hypothetical protein" protein_id=Seg1417.6/GoldUCD/D3Y31